MNNGNVKKKDSQFAGMGKDMTNNDENAKDFIDKTPVFTGNLKFSNIIRNLFFFMSLFLFFFLWETHLEILILIEFCIPAILFPYCIIKRSRLLPKATVATSLFSMAVNIGLSKAFFDSSQIDMHIPLISFLEDKFIHANWITSLIIIFCSLLINILPVKKSYRYASTISKESSIEIISQLADSLAFLYACSIFLIHLAIANIVAGAFFYVPQSELFFFGALKSVLPYVSTNVVFFTVPQIIISLGCDIYSYLIKSKE